MTAPDPSSTVIRNMRIMRNARKWSARELSERLEAVGCSMGKHVIANMESGRAPEITVSRMSALAHVFEVDITEMLTEVCPACHGSPPAGFTCNACGAR